MNKEVRSLEFEIRAEETGQEKRAGRLTGTPIVFDQATDMGWYQETIDRDAQDLYETIVRNQAKQYGVNEELKARDQMEWVRWMNAIRLVAEEVVIKEVLQL